MVVYLVAKTNESQGAWYEFNEVSKIKSPIINENVANLKNLDNHPAAPTYH